MFSSSGVKGFPLEAVHLLIREQVSILPNYFGILFGDNINYYLQRYLNGRIIIPVKPLGLVTPVLAF